MRKVSLKVLIFASICALAALGGCLDPVNLTAFVQDPEVSEIIKKNMASVILVQPDKDGNGGSEGTPGNGKITGLDPNKYYIIERWDEDAPSSLPPSTDIRFVTANGGLTEQEDLEGIGRLIGSEITGLTNNNVYRVTSAKPLPTTSFTLPTGATTSAGQITLPHTATGTIAFTGFGSYDYATPPAAPSAVTGSITLQGAGTTTDYVFYDESLGRNGFYELKVIIDAALPATTGLAITITPYVHPTDVGKFTFTPGNASISRTNAVSNSYTLSIAVTTTPFTGTDTNDGWWYNGSKVTTNTTLDKNVIDTYNTTNPTNKIDFSVGTKHTFTFTGSIGVSPAPVVPYSGTFDILITD